MVPAPCEIQGIIKNHAGMKKSEAQMWSKKPELFLARFTNLWNLGALIPWSLITDLDFLEQKKPQNTALL